jgi:hypothetical protein
VFLAAGLLAALYSCWLRVQADNAYRDVVVLVDWHALISLNDVLIDAELYPPIHSYNQPAEPVHLQLLNAIPGATLCYGEETVGTLLNQGIFTPALIGSDGPAYAVALHEYRSDISAGATRHGYLRIPNTTTDDRLVVQFPNLPEEDLNLLPVAWLGDVIEKAQEEEIPLILRPGGSEFLGRDGIKRTLDFCSEQPLVLFQGPTVLGYPQALGAVASQLAKQDQTFGWVEFDEQDGGAALAAKMAPNVVRIHSIPPEEMVNYDVDSAVARMLRAVRERNIRCIYVRPFVRGGVISNTSRGGFRKELTKQNKQYFRTLHEELAAAGYRTAFAPHVPPNPPSWLVQVRPLFTTLAVGAVGVMLFALWLPAWPRWVWSLFLTLTALKAVAAVFIPMVDMAVMLAAALFFPLWGFWLALTAYQRLVHERPAWHPSRLGAAILALLIASGVTILGGLLIHGGMWDAASMLKVTQFRGVTLALALPVLVLAAYCWQAETLQGAYDAATRRLADYWQRFLTLWQAPIRYGDVAFIFIALGAIAVVLLRSGNESPLEMLSIEGWFRESLEQFFSVRPRTKELIGHPLLIVFFLSLPWRNRLSVLFALAGLLGQISILNTFCHLHTPLLLTTERVLIGLALGIASGVIWGVVMQTYAANTC